MSALPRRIIFISDNSFGVKKADQPGFNLLFFILVLFIILGLVFPLTFCLGSLRKTPVIRFLFPRGHILPTVLLKKNSEIPPPTTVPLDFLYNFSTDGLYLQGLEQISFTVSVCLFIFLLSPKQSADDHFSPYQSLYKHLDQFFFF
jgi:hypothetical protein